MARFKEEIDYYNNEVRLLIQKYDLILPKDPQFKDFIEEIKDLLEEAYTSGYGDGYDMS